jgi:hypothetical protein
VLPPELPNRLSPLFLTVLTVLCADEFSTELWVVLSAELRTELAIELCPAFWPELESTFCPVLSAVLWPALLTGPSVQLLRA